MKKVSILVIGMMLFGYAARSQSRISFKAGLNLANQMKSLSTPQLPSATMDTEPFIGYQLGISYKRKLSSNFSLSAETNFSVIGSSSSLTAPDWQTYDTNE